MTLKSAVRRSCPGPANITSKYSLHNCQVRYMILSSTVFSVAFFRPAPSFGQLLLSASPFFRPAPSFGQPLLSPSPFFRSAHTFFHSLLSSSHFFLLPFSFVFLLSSSYLYFS